MYWKKHMLRWCQALLSDIGKGYIRISYAYEMNVLKEGMRRLELYLKEHYLTC